jgi:hypothetical protein
VDRRLRPDRRRVAQIEEELAKMEIHENRTDEDIAKLGETT